MKIFQAVFKIKSQEFSAYRSNIYLNFLFGCFPLIFSIFLWNAIYRTNNETIGGYYHNEMITYYVIAFLISQILNARSNTIKIAEMIQNGSIHNYVLKPIGFFSLNFKLYIAEKAVYLFNIIIPFMIFCVLMRHYLVVNICNLPVFIISVFLAFTIKYIMGSILGLLTMWLEEITGLLDFWDNIEKFLCGGLIPLSILPSYLYTFVSILPFKYFLFVPIDIYMGKINGIRIVYVFLIQLGWLIVLWFILNFIRKKAYKNYAGYGV